jgi:hypothetical protein
MTDCTEQEFIERLYDVVYKLCSIAKGQAYRFKAKWDEYLKPFNENPHLIRPIPLNKEKFIDNIDYRIEVLKTLQLALVDGFYSIKSLLETLYGAYFNDSAQFKKDFSKQDQVVLKYLAAKEILGNLVQYNRMDHESIPLKYNILARNYSMMRLREIDDAEILKNLTKLNINFITLEKLHDIMSEIESDGFIEIIREDNHYRYKGGTPLELSPEGKKKYNQTLQPLIAWPTHFWRSFYNIRELNVTPGKKVKYRDFLIKVLSKSATQGFSATDFVFKNLIKYYEKLKEEM